MGVHALALCACQHAGLIEWEAGTRSGLAHIYIPIAD